MLEHSRPYFKTFLQLLATIASVLVGIAVGLVRTGRYLEFFWERFAFSIAVSSILIMLIVAVQIFILQFTNKMTIPTGIFFALIGFLIGLQVKDFIEF